MNFWDHFEIEHHHFHTFSKGEKGKVSCEFCSDHWNTTVMLFSSEDDFKKSEFYDGEDRVKGDSKTNIAVWPGKNNVGRDSNSYWLTAPMHPLCGCEIDQLESTHEANEELEDWYSKLEWD